MKPKHYAILIALSSLLLSACESNPERDTSGDEAPPPVASAVPGLNPQDQEELDRLLAQPDIDPLRRYQETHQDDASKQALLEVIETQRQQRCTKAAAFYQSRMQQPSIRQRFIEVYQYACAEQVEQLAKHVADDKDAEQAEALDPRSCRFVLEQGDYPLAWEYCRRLASDGVADAQNILASWYLNGQSRLGVQADPTKAREWFLEAARQNHPQAQFNLGLIHLQGIGVTADPSKAAQWFEAAAMRGVAEAQLNLGLMFSKGQGVPRDPEAAFIWLTLASDEGLHQALVPRDLLLRELSPAVVNAARMRATQIAQSYQRTAQ